MLKKDELTAQNSCLNKARHDEPIFVLLGRDVAAPTTIRYWVEQRIKLGKNKYDDEQIVEALQWADHIEMRLTCSQPS